jgi:hypothetical protein
VGPFSLLEMVIKLEFISGWSFAPMGVGEVPFFLQRAIQILSIYFLPIFYFISGQIFIHLI